MRLTAQKQVWYWGGALAILFLGAGKYTLVRDARLQ